MNQRNITIALAALVVMLAGLIFMVSGNAGSQADERIKKAQDDAKYQITQIKDIVDNNNLLWSLIDSTWRSSDKSIAFVRKLANAQKVPRCNGKECTGQEDESKLRTVVTNNAKERSLRVGWGSSGKSSIKYSFKVYYDAKDKFITIDANDLLGKEPAGEAEEEETAEE